MRFCRRGFKLKQDLQDARIFRMRVLEKSTASLSGRRALPRLDARKKRAEDKTPARQPNMSGSGDPHLQKLPYTPSVDGDRLIAIGTGSGDPAL